MYSKYFKAPAHNRRFPSSGIKKIVTFQMTILSAVILAFLRFSKKNTHKISPPINNADDIYRLVFKTVKNRVMTADKE
ncbi:MAG: hypothetical protein Q4C00_07330, partial [Bacillota bacterium]|nr:hypothetical protein [Bacillota bacterium]